MVTFLAWTALVLAFPVGALLALGSHIVAEPGLRDARQPRDGYGRLEQSVIAALALWAPASFGAAHVIAMALLGTGRPWLAIAVISLSCVLQASILESLLRLLAAPPADGRLAQR